MTYSSLSCHLAGNAKMNLENKVWVLADNSMETDERFKTFPTKQLSKAMLKNDFKM